MLGVNCRLQLSTTLQPFAVPKARQTVFSRDMLPKPSFNQHEDDSNSILGMRLVNRLHHSQARVGYCVSMYKIPFLSGAQVIMSTFHRDIMR